VQTPLTEEYTVLQKHYNKTKIINIYHKH